MPPGMFKDKRIAPAVEDDGDGGSSAAGLLSQLQQAVRAALDSTTPPAYRVRDPFNGSFPCCSAAINWIGNTGAVVGVAFYSIAVFGVYGIREDGSIDMVPVIAPVLGQIHVALHFFWMNFWPRHLDTQVRMALAVLVGAGELSPPREQTVESVSKVTVATIGGLVQPQHVRDLRASLKSVQSYNLRASLLFAVITTAMVYFLLARDGLDAAVAQFGFADDGKVAWHIAFVTGFMLLGLSMPITTGPLSVVSAMWTAPSYTLADTIEAIVRPLIADGDSTSGLPRQAAREMYGKLNQVRRANRLYGTGLGRTIVWVFVAHLVCEIGNIVTIVAFPPRFNAYYTIATVLGAFGACAMLSPIVLINTFTQRGKRHVNGLRVEAGAAGKIELERDLARVASTFDDCDTSVRILGVAVTPRMLASVTSAIVAVAWFAVTPFVQELLV